jgi:eukaryotic-like serine/threonine-protein kinase
MQGVNMLRRGGPRRIVAILCAGAAIAVVASVMHLSPASPRAVTALAIPAGFQDWTMYRHDQTHSGISGETILSSSTIFKLHWSVTTASTGTTTLAYTSPAIVFNGILGRSLVYIGNQQGDMNAYDAATGLLVWSYKVPKTVGLSKEIESSPAVSNNTLYFGDGDWHEYALNATTGALICRSQSLGGITAASPVVANTDGKGDVVYFGDAGPSGSLSDGGHLWAMYGVGNSAGAACGTKWMFDAFGSPAGSQTGKSGVYSSVAFGHLGVGGTGTPVVVVGSTDPDDSIYEVNASTGALLWRFQTLVGIDSDIGAPATIAGPGAFAAFPNGVVFDTGKDAYTYALNLKTGAQIWSFAIRKTIGHGNPTQSGAALVGNALYLGYGAGVFSLNATTGALNWISTPIGGVVSSPSISGPAGSQVMFVGDIKGGVYAFSLSGAKLFSYSTGALVFGSAGISTGQFFIASSNGNLYAFGK